MTPLSQVAAVLALTGEGEPESLVGAKVSADFFEVLRARPALGRTFAAEESEPSYVAGYLLELAAAANKLYNEVPVLVAGDEELTAARVRLVDGARGVLRTGLDLLGMSAPEEM